MNSLLIGLIVAVEIGFWVLLGGGLITRDVFGLRRTSVVLRVGAPAVDLVVLVAAVLDLRAGGAAAFAHALAAAYLGFSVGFGLRTIRWADQRFAHRFADAPPPPAPPRHGRARARHEWRLWGRAALGWGVACGLLGLAIVGIGDPARTAHLGGWINGLTAALMIWLVAWPLPCTLWPKRPPHST